MRIETFVERGGEGIRTPINSLTAGVICRRTHGRSATPPPTAVSSFARHNLKH